jgi:hypothetical protein
VCPSSFIDRRRVCQIPHTLHRSKALKHGHCRSRTSSIGADRGDDGIRIYELAGSFLTINNIQITSRRRLVERSDRRVCSFIIAVASRRVCGFIVAVASPQVSKDLHRSGVRPESYPRTRELAS